MDLNLPKLLIIVFVTLMLITLVVKYVKESEYYIPKPKHQSSYDFIQDRIKLALEISEPTTSKSNIPTEHETSNTNDNDEVQKRLARESKETKAEFQKIADMRRGGRLSDLENAVNNNLETLRQKRNSNEIPDSSASYNLKSGWCFIGNDRNHRSCFPVGRKDMCISENIYPTREICINPSLRFT